MSPRSPKAGTTSSLRRLAAVVLVAACAVIVGATTAAASNPVPYTDFQAKGDVGLCDRSGRAVTSGRITDRPFVWFAVSSMPAPQGYAGPGRKATLFIYQPRPSTYPNQWSADQMTSSSPYTNPRYPMAAATVADFSLQDYIAEFPPRWNGLLQLRIYYGAPGKPTWTDTYAATDIKVTGSTWSVVRGGSVPCTKGTAKPNETFRITPSPTGCRHEAVRDAVVDDERVARSERLGDTVQIGRGSDLGIAGRGRGSVERGRHRVRLGGGLVAAGSRGRRVRRGRRDLVVPAAHRGHRAEVTRHAPRRTGPRGAATAGRSRVFLLVAVTLVTLVLVAPVLWSRASARDVTTAPRPSSVTGAAGDGRL